MNIEIERKFLVKDESFKRMATESHRLTQGYICKESGRTVRVRLWDDKGYLTIKGGGSASGMSRYEWEKEIPADEARELMELCVGGVIDKTRYIVPYGGHTFEVDEFQGDNRGLVVAEVELSATGEAFERPPFLGREVTGQVRYYNSQLMQRPYSTWSEEEKSGM